MLAPVRDSLARDEALRWVRVNRLPDYVYFNHSIHIAKGVGCSTCHGAVDRMQLTARANSRSRCNGASNATVRRSKFLRPPEEIWNTLVEAACPTRIMRARRLARKYHVGSPARLSDCSTCHR